jgi:hypothetical protein
MKNLFIILSILTTTSFSSQFTCGDSIEIQGQLVTLTASPRITGDEKPHKFLALVLDNPINFKCKSEGSNIERIEKNIKEFHLNMNGKPFDQFKRLEGQTVLVRGLTYHSHNGYHYTPIIISVDSIEPISQIGSSVNVSSESILCQAIVYAWNEANNNKNLHKLSKLYDSKVKYYGTKMVMDKILKDKTRFYNKYPNFHQTIVSDIVCKPLKNISNSYRCEFTKKVVFGGKEKDFPSYLEILLSPTEIDGDKVITESDYVTDRNLKKKF